MRAFLALLAVNLLATSALAQFNVPQQQNIGNAPNPFQQQRQSSIPSIPQSAQPNQQPVLGDEAPTEANSTSYVPEWVSGLKGQLVAGGPLMFPLGICAAAVTVLVFERLFSMRRSRVIPRPFVRRFREKTDDGSLDYDESVELCSEFDCPVADVFLAAVKRSGRATVEIEAAVMDALERTADSLRRNLRVFHAISNVAPLIGLLGTVLGMINAFETMASESGIGRPELLAEGISQALITTAGGLCVAIPAYLAYMYFSSRADRYLGEIESLSLSVIDAVSAEGGGPAKTKRRRAA